MPNVKSAYDRIKRATFMTNFRGISPCAGLLKLLLIDRWTNPLGP